MSLNDWFSIEKARLMGSDIIFNVDYYDDQNNFTLSS